MKNSGLHIFADFEQMMQPLVLHSPQACRWRDGV
ncbi:exonuclease SbcD [Vibrio cholerae]|nr:exonuclease SbcD [Vibrio cholerae]